MKGGKILPLAAVMVVLIETASAHCPLCTAGIAAAGVGASWLGVDLSVVGIFVGGFAFAMGFWVSHWLGEEYVPYQEWVFAGSSFLLTVVPVLPMFSSAIGVPVFITGQYGSPLYSVYLVDKFLLGSLAGAALVSLSPTLSRKITGFRGDPLPFQGTMLTVVLLLAAGSLIQAVMVWPL